MLSWGIMSTRPRGLGLVLLGACAGTSRPSTATGPRGLRASEHREAARDYEQRARDRARWPEETPSPDRVGMPWIRRWDAGADDAQVAAIHRARAAELEAAYEQACGTRALADIAVSPLQRYAIAVWPTSTGVIMYLAASAGPADRLLADMKCHRAWMMLAPQASMEDCPLDLPGIEVDARGGSDAITVSIVSRDPALVDELHRRAARDLETSYQLRPGAGR